MANSFPLGLGMSQFDRSIGITVDGNKRDIKEIYGANIEAKDCALVCEGCHHKIMPSWFKRS